MLLREKSVKLKFKEILILLSNVLSKRMKNITFFTLTKITIICNNIMSLSILSRTVFLSSLALRQGKYAMK